MNKIATWTTVEGRNIRTVSWGEVSLELDMENPLHILLWDAARNFDQETENIARHAKGVAQQATKAAEMAAAGMGVDDPSSWSDARNLTVAIATRNGIGSQLHGLVHFATQPI